MRSTQKPVVLEHATELTRRSCSPVKEAHVPQHLCNLLAHEGIVRAPQHDAVDLAAIAAYQTVDELDQGRVAQIAAFDMLDQAAAGNRNDPRVLCPALLKAMEQKKLLCRTRDSADERIVKVSITESGEALKEKARTIPERISSCISIAKEDAVALYRILYKLLEPAQEC